MPYVLRDEQHTYNGEIMGITFDDKWEARIRKTARYKSGPADIAINLLFDEIDELRKKIAELEANQTES